MPSAQFIAYQINQNVTAINEVAEDVATVNANVDTVKNKIDTDLPTRASQTSVNTIDTIVDTILTKVDTEIQDILDRANLLSTQASQDLIKSVVDNIYSKVDTEVSAILTRANLLSTQATQDTIDTNIDALIARLTSSRAGYLDNLKSIAKSNIDICVQPMETLENITVCNRLNVNFIDSFKFDAENSNIKLDLIIDDVNIFTNMTSEFGGIVLNNIKLNNSSVVVIVKNTSISYVANVNCVISTR